VRERSPVAFFFFFFAVPPFCTLASSEASFPHWTDFLCSYVLPPLIPFSFGQRYSQLHGKLFFSFSPSSPLVELFFFVFPPTTSPRVFEVPHPFAFPLVSPLEERRHVSFGAHCRSYPLLRLVSRRLFGGPRLRVEFRSLWSFFPYAFLRCFQPAALFGEVLFLLLPF